MLVCPLFFSRTSAIPKMFSVMKNSGAFVIACVPFSQDFSTLSNPFSKVLNSSLLDLGYDFLTTSSSCFIPLSKSKCRNWFSGSFSSFGAKKAHHTMKGDCR